MDAYFKEIIHHALFVVNKKVINLAHSVSKRDRLIQGTEMPGVQIALKRFLRKISQIRSKLLYFCNGVAKKGKVFEGLREIFFQKVPLESAHLS